MPTYANDLLHHFSITIHLHLACFYATKYLEKNFQLGKMLIEQLIEFELRDLGSCPHMYSYNWLFSWQGKISSSALFVSFECYIFECFHLSVDYCNRRIALLRIWWILTLFTILGILNHFKSACMPNISALGTACFLEFFFCVCVCVCVMCEYFSYGLSLVWNKCYYYIIIYCLNIARGNVPYFPYWAKSLTKFNPNCKILDVFWT